MPDPPICNAVTINPDFGCVEWPGGIDLCSDPMDQVMTGSEAELHSTTALREAADNFDGQLGRAFEIIIG